MSNGETLDVGAFVIGSGGVCAPLSPLYELRQRLVDRPAWVEITVDLHDADRERARLAAIGADIDRCRRGESPVYKLLPPEPVRLPTFTAPRGGIRFIQPLVLTGGETLSITQTITST